MAETRRGRGRQPRISREMVLAVARQLPPDTLTLTAISDRLGVSQPAIYRYFPDRRGVLAAIAQEVRDTLIPPDESLPWDEWLAAAARLERTLWRKHADLYQAANVDAILGPTLRVVRVGIQVLTAAGFTVVDALAAITQLNALAHGLSFGESKAEELLACQDIGEIEAMLGPDPAAITSDAIFERGLAITIEGLRSLHRPAAPARPRRRSAKAT